MDARDASYLLDMFDSARFAQEFMDGVERDAFMQDRKTQSAVIRELLIVGEAAKNVSMAFRSAHPEIPWRSITGMRDVLVHDYRNVNLGNVWIAATESVTELIEKLEPLVPDAEDPDL
jgi:uncharacterized protein with HEPN domain